MKRLCVGVQRWKIVFARTFLFVFYLSYLTGCGPALSSPDQVRKFEKAGPITPGVDVGDLDRAGTRIGPYRVVPGDLLELQIPAFLQVASSDVSGLVRADLTLSREVRPYLCRVSEAGNITLPIIGEIPAAGKTVAEVESSIINAYFPKYAVGRPMVVCQIAKYQRESERVFTVMGLVNRPSIFPYPPDIQYNLTEALASAGGVNMVADPRYVKIYRQDVNGDIVSATFGIDSKSFADAYTVVIKPGDVVCVDHTLRTRVNDFFASIVRIHVGADVRAYRDTK
ncbi:MAG: polysaccharide biosynthesis/export family protein [Planctomycetes bacterium]|nr:polysaccharide biosynthesis/export family protein [Planctomycetota bacterium]